MTTRTNQKAVQSELRAVSEASIETMKLKAKTRLAIKANGKSIKQAKKAVKKAVAKVVSNQWKLVKELGLDKLLGHGGIYNLRKGDITGNIVGDAAKGKATRQAVIFAGERGLCFLDGNFVGATMNVGGRGLNTANIRHIKFRGSPEAAIRYVRANGKANAGFTKAGERFTHHIQGGHYSVATDGKRLLRTEEAPCTDGAKKFTYALGSKK